MANVIEVENMSFGYTRDMILENVDFAVEEGDFAVVIGDNGVGKSTMVKLLLGAIRPTKGKISIPFNNEDELERVMNIIDKLKEKD